MITIVNYGLGNIQAFADIYRRLNIPVTIAHTHDELSGAQKIILPGVGAFDWAMERLKASGMREMLDNLVINKQRPVLGVCVGMQIMAQRSDEGISSGLGWVPGEVKRFDTTAFIHKTHLPHMGWNDAAPIHHDSIFRRMTNSRFYFLHSYYFKPDIDDTILSYTNYGIDFASSINYMNIYGTQFHPEKSHHWGIQLLKNFAEL